jgi:hypothetical protein
MEKRYPVKNPDVVAREEDKEALLFNPADGNILCINRTGILVWGLCDGSRSRDDIARKITEKQEVSLDEARKDCDKFFEDLGKTGFITYKIQEVSCGKRKISGSHSV